MNPVLLQKQLKDNAADFNDFYKELKAWGDDMKRKEASVTGAPTGNEKRKDGNLSKKKKKVEFSDTLATKKKASVTDYSAWDKFDVDAECEKIDYNENEDSDLTDECDESVRDQAYLEKEKGNKFVQKKNWDEAIACYNKAISHYSYDPIFYANRALCFLKKEDYIKAELDCTMSLKLDATYVKALQRRAASREALGKLREAESDLLRVLELEPKNKESSSSLATLRTRLATEKSTERPNVVSKFAASRNKKSSQYQTKISDQVKEQDDIFPVKAVVKAVHQQSKKPLKRIEIREVNGVSTSMTLKTDDLKVIEKQQATQGVTKDNKNQTNMKINDTQVQLTAPSNSVQFYSQWKQLKTIEARYAYLKMVQPESLPTIFQESLESGVFSEIIEVLAKCYITDGQKVGGFLRFFPQVKRFSTLVLFMTDTDKNYLRKLFDHALQHGESAKEEIELLIKRYEI